MKTFPIQTMNIPALADAFVEAHGVYASGVRQAARVALRTHATYGNSGAETHYTAGWVPYMKASDQPMAALRKGHAGIPVVVTGMKGEKFVRSFKDALVTLFPDAEDAVKQVIRVRVFTHSDFSYDVALINESLGDAFFTTLGGMFKATDRKSPGQAASEAMAYGLLRAYAPGTEQLVMGARPRQRPASGPGDRGYTTGNAVDRF